jgi:hypothetical protein
MGSTGLPETSVSNDQPTRPNVIEKHTFRFLPQSIEFITKCNMPESVINEGSNKVKVKQSHYRPGQALRITEVEASRFQDNRHMKVVRLSALSTGRLYPQKIFLVLISARG